MRCIGPAARRLQPRASTISRVQLREYNFASSSYRACFPGQPTPDGARLRADTLAYLAAFDAQAWYDDPVATIVDGRVCSDGSIRETIDAFNRPNGRQLLATPGEFEQVRAHITSWKPPKNDYRDEVRRIEQLFLTDYAGTIIGNQALDFSKQDGVTEIEESIEANHVERNLNDLLLADEVAGNVTISRAPAFVGCVSNFSNFLDLFRKTIRNIELGVPVVVLSRSNTTQHMYRWTQLLLKLMDAEGLPAGLVTYASCGIEEQRRLFRENQGSPMYFTGSRPVAAAIKEVMPKLVASTGGPNTMVATTLSDKVAAATRMSTLIENSGQCTAMRHLIVPACTEAEVVDKIFSAASVRLIDHAREALESGEFAAMYRSHPTAAGSDSALDGYSKHPSLPIAFKVSDSLPGDDIDEMWRQGFLDVTTVGDTFGSPEFTSNVAEWLNKHQPISLVVNGDYALMRTLWEKSGMVVNTAGLGDEDASAALTAQARPQDGEIFGEFPPRRQLLDYTRFPAIVPSATAGYNTSYTESMLESAAAHCPSSLRSVCDSQAIAGYCGTLATYLQDACGPHEGSSLTRTVLFGLQRPPLDGGASVVRLGAGSTVDDVAPYLVPFLITNARETLQISAPVAAKRTVEALQSSGSLDGIPVVFEESCDMNARLSSEPTFNVIHPLNVATSDPGYALAAHFVSNLLPIGHVKSTKLNDKRFIEYFSASEKWLKTTTN